MATLQVLNPEVVSQGDIRSSKPAPRPSTLDGKRIGLIWNDKRGGDVALRRVGELLSERYDDVQVFFYAGATPTPEPVRERAFEECDVFVGSTGD